jgi:hypothetical protein
VSARGYGVPVNPVGSLGRAIAAVFVLTARTKANSCVALRAQSELSVFPSSADTAAVFLDSVLGLLARGIDGLRILQHLTDEARVSTTARIRMAQTAQTGPCLHMHFGLVTLACMQCLTHRGGLRREIALDRCR